MTRHRVVVIEDDRRYRASLEQLFDHVDGFQLAAAFASPPPAIAAAERSAETGAMPWDIAIMDLEMPEMSGIDATRRLKALLPSLKIVVLTVFEDPGAIVEAVSQVRGAFSFVMMTKDRLIGVRDPHGFRPLAIGKLGEAFVICSETCALDLIGATYVRDVEPGEVVIVSAQGLKSIKPFGVQPAARRTQVRFASA